MSEVVTSEARLRATHEIFPGAAQCQDLLDAAQALRLVLMMRAFRQVQRRPGSAQSKFMREVAGADPRDLSARQRHYVLQCAWDYRRQMPPGVAPETDPGKFEDCSHG